MHKQNISCVLVLILVMTWTCGCAGPPIHPDASVPLKHGEGAKYTDEGNVISALVKMEMKQAGHNYVADGALIMKMPSYLRLEVRGILGGAILCVTVNPQRMSIYVPSKKEFYRGKPVQENMGKFFLLPLEVEDIMKMLTGSILDMTNPNGELLDQGKDDRPQIALDKSGFSQALWFKNKRLSKWQRLDKNQNVLFTVEYVYDETRDSLPARVNFLTADGRSLSMTYLDVQEEIRNDLSVFDMDVPDDVRIISLD